MWDSVRPVRGTAYDDAKSSCAPNLSTARRSAAAPDLFIFNGAPANIYRYETSIFSMKFHGAKIDGWSSDFISPANWRSRSVTVCFTCARKIVFEHKINLWVDVERMVSFSCVWLCCICLSFEFTLGSCVFTLRLRCYWAHCELKMVSNQHIVNTKHPEHTLAPICWIPIGMAILNGDFFHGIADHHTKFQACFRKS